MNEKEHIYRELVVNKNPEKLDDLWNQLDQILEQSEGRAEGLDLTPEQISSILRRYLENGLTAQQVEDWANYIEAVSYFMGDIGEDAMHIIHCLANPVLEGPLTQQKSQRLIDLLAKGMPTEEEAFAAYANRR